MPKGVTVYRYIEENCVFNVILYLRGNTNRNEVKFI
jgi:hypothetical protein